MFGPIKLPFRALKQVYNREIYEQLCRRQGADPLDKTGYFPAYRAVNGSGFASLTARLGLTECLS